MANIRDLIEHIAKKHWEYGRGGLWECPENAPYFPFPAYAGAYEKHEFRAYATRLLEDAPILDTAMQDDQLRELLSYCRTEAQNLAAEHQPEDRGSWAYADVADKLSAILDGEQ